MDGLFQTDQVKRQREKIIETWMLTIIQDGGIDRFDSLHIDRIDAHWKSRDAWVEGAFEAYRLAVDTRDRHRLGLPIVLAFALSTVDDPSEADFGTREQLQASLNWMPPALYLFRPGQEFWTQTDGSSAAGAAACDVTLIKIDPNIFRPSARAKACYYMKFKQADSGEYSRSIFVEG